MKYFGFYHVLVFRAPSGIALMACGIGLWLAFGVLTQCFAENPTFGRPTKTVVLDPGHGGHDAGAIGPGGSMEKDVALEVARRVAQICGETNRIVLTRTGDHGLEIYARSAMANHLKADLFVSIHTGGSFRHQVEGTYIYHYEPPEADGLEDPAVEPYDARGPTVWDHLQDRHSKDSRKLGDFVQQRLQAGTKPMNEKHQGLPLLVLQGADMPAILVEVATLTNPAWEKALNDPVFQTAAAEAMCAAIDDFFAP